jgi:hypothetical protein
VRAFEKECDLALVLAVAASGCARITVRRHAVALPIAETVTERRDEYAWGLLSFNRAVDLRDRCPSGREGSQDGNRYGNKDPDQVGGWESITLEQRPIQKLIRVATLGIYSPWTVTETCSARR